MPSIWLRPRGREPGRPILRPIQRAQQHVVREVGGSRSGGPRSRAGPARRPAAALRRTGGGSPARSAARPGMDADVDVLAIEVGGLVRGGDLHVDARDAAHGSAPGAAPASAMAKVGGSFRRRRPSSELLLAPAASPARSGRARCAPGGNRRCPAASARCRGAPRRNSLTSSQSSRLATCRLTAPCVTHSSLAARVKLPLRAAASKARTAFSGGRRRDMALPSNFLMVKHAGLIVDCESRVRATAWPPPHKINVGGNNNG